ncbi:2-dehydro-3-deoxy-6-phosphogalactonate aldolase [Albimonas sp. CAU 1670]|uniref:2-dehydro-3-deoxy-6-phosphogalactonate aldolase n=1 Tax=Albimonas sp. CAU 1670 TaxID=3032599 RepID=UPI0023DC6554|nr:2-dehydro-3-deoxy-6-phosphogalactonate aldolase [Albimonas sp. CAU 1670]MDF2233580.1 2-dehydro-3-deoxy-6-phosphogalactonate aldolase [Albimonas sp. CAU 1670]
MIPLDAALDRLPLIAILRGIAPPEALPVGKALVDAGFSILEAPLNSPEPYDTIRQLADAHGETCLIGAGTVLTPEQVQRTADAGGRIIVSPNFNAEVVRATKRLGLVSCPGVFTPSEAFAALDAGADCLKIFPGDAIAPKFIKAIRAVLPASARIVVTGGVGVANLAEFMEAGADGAGIGSALYKPGRPASEVGIVAAQLVAAVRAAREAA